MNNAPYPKEQLIKDVETIRGILTMVSTGVSTIQVENDSYIALQNSVRKNLKQLNIEYRNDFRGLWDWYDYYTKEQLSTYQQRRMFLAELLNPTLNALDDYDQTKPSINDDLSNIKRIDSKYDVFVSHASADKVDFVSDLVTELNKVTKDVWYDSKMIQWGNSLKSKINEGLEKCEFGIVVFSKSFIGREWTEIELENLLKKQNDNKKDVILPILLDDLSIEDFSKKYPSLNDIVFIKQIDHDKRDIALMFAERLIERLKERN